mgnify:CR=1 FL=1
MAERSFEVLTERQVKSGVQVIPLEKWDEQVHFVQRIVLLVRGGDSCLAYEMQDVDGHVWYVEYQQ